MTWIKWHVITKTMWSYNYFTMIKKWLLITWALHCYALPMTTYHYIFIVCLNVSIWKMEILFYCLCRYANVMAFVAHCKYGYFSMTFLGKPFSFMFFNFMFFSMKSLKLTKTFMGGMHCNVFLYPFEIYEGYIFDVSNASIYNS